MTSNSPWTPKRWLDEVRGGLVTLRELDPTLATRLVYGADERGRLSFGLITHQPPGVPQLSDAVTIVRAQREYDGTWILLFTLEDSTFSEVFVQLCGHVHAKVAEALSERAGITKAMEAFAEWRQLFQAPKRRVLSLDECRGLFAELDFGFSVLGEVVRASSVVEGWQGPYGSDQDFQFVDVQYEVKSRHTTTHALKIASEYQLDGDKIVLVCVEVVESGEALPGFMTLADKVNRTRAAIALDGVGLAAFDDALDQLSYDPGEQFYDQVYFSTRDLQFYAVSEGFPRITARDLDPGVVDVRYRIQLTSLDEFAIDKSAALGRMNIYGDV